MAVTYVLSRVESHILEYHTACMKDGHSHITMTCSMSTLSPYPAPKAPGTINTPTHADMHIRRRPGVGHAIG